MKIILTGYMGSGKTAVGMELTARLNLKYIDLDDEISRRENKTISEIFKESGEIYFRRRESGVLKELLEQESNFVLSLGGGTPCYGNNLQEIKNTPQVQLVYLKTGLTHLKERLFKEKEQRPLIRHLDTFELLEDYIRKHLFERAYYYNQSDLIITTDDKTVPEVVEEVVEGLN